MEAIMKDHERAAMVNRITERLARRNPGLPQSLRQIISTAVSDELYDMIANVRTPPPATHINIKHNDRYRLLSTALDCTNLTSGRQHVIYCPETAPILLIRGEDSPLYIREINEFQGKFAAI